MSLAEIPADLIRRSQAGEVEALNELIVRISPDLRRLIYRQVRDPEDSDEIIQECLIRLSRHLPKMRDISKFPAWVMRMLFNQCYTFHKKKAATRFYQYEEAIEVTDERLVWPASKSMTPRQTLIQKEVAEEINAAVLDLPPRQRAAFTLFELESHSIREVAEILTISEGAVKFNIHQARKKLKKALKHYVSGPASESIADSK